MGGADRSQEADAIATAGALLSDRDLPAIPLDLAPDTHHNFVILAPEHVVRISHPEGADQRAAAAKATEAARLGVSVPRCVGYTRNWSIWTRIPGTSLLRAEGAHHRVWAALTRDLARIHAMPAPSDVPAPALTQWVALLPHIPHLSPDELRTLGRISELAPRRVRMTYTHGSVRSENVMVNPAGGYGGLVDWDHADWAPPEKDYALLDPAGLRFALDAPMEALDWQLVACYRVAAAVVDVAHQCRPIEVLWEALGFWELMR